MAYHIKLIANETPSFITETNPHHSDDNENIPPAPPIFLPERPILINQRGTPTNYNAAVLFANRLDVGDDSICIWDQPNDKINSVHRLTPDTITTVFEGHAQDVQIFFDSNGNMTITGHEG